MMLVKTGAGRFLWALSFVLLPVRPELFTILVALLGISTLTTVRHRVLPLALLLSSFLLILAPQTAVTQIKHTPYQVTQNHGLSNLIDWRQQFAWRGFEPKRFAGPVGRVEDGWVYVPRKNPYTHVPYTAILAPEFDPLELKTHQSYTFSFYLQSKDEKPIFWVGFWVERGAVYPVQPRFESLSDGRWRVAATFTTPQSERLERVALEGITGQWSELGFSAAQLWKGAEPVPFTSNEPLDKRLITVSRWGGQVLLGLLMLYGSWFLISKVDPRWLATGVFLGLLLHFSVTLSQYLSTSGQDDRVVGWSVQPNVLAHLSVASAGLVTLLGGRVLGGLSVLVAGGLTLMTGSRSALIGLGLLCLLCLLKPGWRSWHIWLGVGIAVALMIFSLALPQVWNRFTTVGDFEFLTTQARLQIWGVAFEALRLYPLTGIGLDGFAVFYLNHRPSLAVEAEVSHAHNLFLDLAAGGGLPALLGFGLIWGWLLHRLIRLQQWGVIGFLGVVVLLNLFDFTWFTAGVHSAVWVAIAFGLRRLFMTGLR